MRCAVIAAVLLLVYIQDAAAVSKEEVSAICNSKYPPIDCGDGWYRIDPRRCAKHFKQQKIHFYAEEHCKSLGGHLVSMHNADEYSKVMCLALRATNNRNTYWTGGRVNGRQFAFQWTDGTNNDFNRWYTGQPDEVWERCVEMNYGEWGRWNNQDCGLIRPFVCAKTMIPSSA